MKEKELKKCPFCGGIPEIKHYGNNHTYKRFVEIKCSNKFCRATQKIGAIKFDMEWCETSAIEMWNKRTNDLIEQTTDYKDNNEIDDISKIQKETKDDGAKLRKSRWGPYNVY